MPASAIPECGRVNRSEAAEQHLAIRRACNKLNLQFTLAVLRLGVHVRRLSSIHESIGE
jgi:hypothetical protein